jgi:uncharacterized protein (TIGR04255 family)
MKPYKNPPIIEAICYLNLLPSEAAELAQIEALKIEGYPIKRPQVMFQGQFQSGGTPFTSTEAQTIGYFFESADKKKVVQIRTNGFSFNRLPPYDGWESFVEEAKKLWSVYESCLGQSRVAHMGLRYVNRIEVQLPLGNLRDWMSTYPEIGSDADFSHFLMQVQLPQLDIDAIAVVNETIMPKFAQPPKAGVQPTAVYIMLDIDINQSAENLGTDELWERFEILRERKNKIFKESITEKTEELFN